MTALYLAIRDIDPETDPEAPRYGAPALPGSWAVQRGGGFDDPVYPAPTWHVTRPTGDRLLVVRCNAIGARALYAIRGDSEWLDSLDQTEVAPAREVYRLGLAGPGTARNVLRAWRWWRCDVTERLTQADIDAGAVGSVGDPVQRDGVTRELSAEGVLLPDPGVDALPWDLAADGTTTTPPLAAIRVRALIRPALAPGGVPWTMAGAGDHEALESERDRADPVDEGA